MGSLQHAVEDCLEIVKVFSNGSICWSEDITLPMEVEDDGTAVWKDCLYDKKHNLHLRLYKPRSTATANLPVLYFFRGGNFYVNSRTRSNCHNCCLRLASALQVLVVAPDYHLSPEHRPSVAVAAVQMSGCGKELTSPECSWWVIPPPGTWPTIWRWSSAEVELRRGSADLAPIWVRGYVLMRLMEDCIV